MFNPVSPIIILSVGFLLNIISKDDIAPKWLKSFSKKDNIDTIFWVIGIWFLLAFIYFLWEKNSNRLNEQVNSLAKELEKKDRQIEYNSGVIFHKYGELAKFNKRQKFYDFLKSLVESNPMIQLAQIYIFSTKISYNKTKIRVNFEEVYAYENVETNGMLQSYFIIPLDIFLDMQEINKLSRVIAEENFDSEEVVDCIYQNIKDRVDKLTDKILKRLNSLTSIDECEDSDTILYRILLLLIDWVQSDYDSGTVIEKILENEDVKEFILDFKRTGIMGSILRKDIYMFKHSGKSSKNGRIYVGFYFKLYKEEHILLVAIPPSELSEVDNFLWNKELTKMREDIRDRLTTIF
jgi:hypothetical protein